MGVDFETKCEQTALDYIKIHLQEGYLVTAYKDVGNYYWESVYKIRASLTTNRKTEQTERGSDDSQNDISASHSLRTVEDGDEQSLKGSERLVKGSEQTEPTISKMEQVDKDINVRSKDEPYIDIETGILHWCGWKYKRIYEDEPQTERSE